MRGRKRSLSVASEKEKRTCPKESLLSAIIGEGKKAKRKLPYSNRGPEADNTNDISGLEKKEKVEAITHP